MRTSTAKSIQSEGFSERERLADQVLDLFKKGSFSFWEWDQKSNTLKAPGFFSGNSLEDWIIRVHPRDQADFSQFLDRLTEPQGQNESITYRVRSITGKQWITVHQTMEVKTDSPAAPHCCLIELIANDSLDGTSLDQLEGELSRDFQEKLDENEKLASLGKLAGGIAHDFNNVLTVIQGHLMLLEQSLDTPLRKQDGESFGLLKEATDQAAGLAKQLLHVGNRHKTSLEVCDLNRIIENFVTMVRRMVEESIELEVRLDPKIGFVRADSVMIGQVLMNLILNAREAVSDRGGKISIQTHVTQVNEEDGPLSLGDYVEFTVSDNGTGISGESLSKIFTPYFSTKGRGTGLGLANVASIVAEHGGTIDAESKEGEGTTFTILLPSAPKALKAPQDNRDTPSPSAPKKRVLEGTKILLVEDESAVRMLVRKLLEMLGCIVIEAESGRQALEIWPEIQDDISLVVSDIVMPEGVSGWDLARELRKNRPEVGILLTSGYCESPDEHNLGGDSQVAFLQKPYESRNLESTLSALLKN